MTKAEYQKMFPAAVVRVTEKAGVVAAVFQLPYLGDFTVLGFGDEEDVWGNLAAETKKRAAACTQSLTWILENAKLP